LKVSLGLRGGGGGEFRTPQKMLLFRCPCYSISDKKDSDTKSVSGEMKHSLHGVSAVNRIK
jgi:hypothetical protein